MKGAADALNQARYRYRMNAPRARLTTLRLQKGLLLPQAAYLPPVGMIEENTGPFAGLYPILSEHAPGRTERGSNSRGSEIFAAR